MDDDIENDYGRTLGDGLAELAQAAVYCTAIFCLAWWLIAAPPL